MINLELRNEVSDVERESLCGQLGDPFGNLSTMSLPSWIKIHSTGVTVSLKVQPRASKNEVVGAIGEQLKLKVTAPPVDSAANEAVLRFLADRLGCPNRAIELVRGGTSRSKVISIQGLTADEVVSKLTT